MATDPLETRRLLLHPVDLADAEQVQQLFPQWEVVEFLNARVPWPFPPDGVLTYYRDIALPAMRRSDEWHWTLRLKTAPAQVIGALCLHRNSDQQKTNRAFWLGLPWRGQGLMTEAVIATNDYWFDVLGFERLRVSKAVANIASRKISLKTGMRLIATRESDYVSGRLSTQVWEITSAEWHAVRSGLPVVHEERKIGLADKAAMRGGEVA